MADRLEQDFRRTLDDLSHRGLRRTSTLDGPRPGIADFGSNDYLGLATDPRIVEAVVEATETYGVGGRSARLLRGGCPLHERAEAAAAAWLGTEAALLFPSGYQANLGLVGALVGRGDVVVSDRDNHASLIDAARLSRARTLVHAHNDLDHLERALRSAAGARRRLVLTEGVFSMGGDTAPLAAIEELCRRYDAWMVVDEAHSAGLLGPDGAGAWASVSNNVTDSRVCARIVTGGKALGVAGAFVVGSDSLRQVLIHKARSFLFTTAPPPALAAGLLAAIACCRGADHQRSAVLGLARSLAERLDLPEPDAAIVPVPVGGAEDAVALAKTLEQRGFYAPAVRPPTVPPGESRLRVVCHADHRPEQIAELARVVREENRQLTAPATATNRATAHLTCVVGTDTGIGKTVVSAVLVRAARRLLDPSTRYWKPIQTGDDDDTAEVVQLSGIPSEDELPNFAHYALPASPHEAAAAEHARVDVDALQASLLKHLHRTESPMILEFAGGLMVPLRADAERTYLQADWLERMPKPRVVLVARSELGTLNHTLLTLEALRARRIAPVALFLVGPHHHSNRETLRSLGGLERIYELPYLEPLDAPTIDSWLASNDLTPIFS